MLPYDDIPNIRVAGPGSVDPDPNPTFKKKMPDQGLTFQKHPDPDGHTA